VKTSAAKKDPYLQSIGKSYGFQKDRDLQTLVKTHCHFVVNEEEFDEKFLV
jgi:hypothetical protein